MKRLHCTSELGCCLIGNNDWVFAVPNIGGDGTTKISIFDKEDKEFSEYEKKHNLKFISSAHGTFNIYSHDIARPWSNDEVVIATLSGSYGVYQGKMEVVFVSWNRKRF